MVICYTIAYRLWISMPPQLPLEEQTSLHERMLAGDASAFSRIFTAVHLYLNECMEVKFPQENNNDREQVIVDVLFAYYKNPTRYHASESSLFSYLLMDAEGDMLNLIQRE